MRPRDVLLATLVVVVWGSNFVVIDYGLAVVPPLLFVAMRFALVVFPAVLLVPPPGVGWRPVVLVGLLMSAGQFGLTYVAMHLGMPAGLTSLVLQAQVLFTVLIAAVALHERPTRAQLLGVGLGVAGLVLVAVGRSAVAPLLPLLLVVAGALSWAVGNVVARQARARSGLSLVVWSGLVVPVPLLVLSALLEGPERMAHALTHLTPVAVGSAAFTAWGASLLGYGVWNSLLARHPAGTVAPFTMLVPVTGMLTAAVVLGEVPTAAEVLGGLLLLAGVATAVVRVRRFRPAGRALGRSPAPAQRRAAAVEEATGPARIPVR